MEGGDRSQNFKGLKPSIVCSVFSAKLTELFSEHKSQSTLSICNGKPHCQEAIGGVDNAEDQDNMPNNYQDGHVSIPSAQGLTCSTCKVKFQSVAEQRMHFKLDWHRLNVKYTLEGKKMLNEEEFEDHISDVSSISGSDSEGDTNDYQENASNENASQVQQNEDKESAKKERPESYNRMFYYDGTQNAYSMYKCLLKDENKVTLHEFSSAIGDLRKSGCCIIIAMMSGGHFASGIFHGDHLVEHKTFHRYTVRAKRGTSQGVHDNTKFARSAGANLRRHNEAALAEDIKEMFARWTSHLEHATYIFLKFPSYSRQVFFGKGRPFDKGDNRIRKIPFLSRRPTLKEVERVFAELTSIQCFDVTLTENKTTPVPNESPEEENNTSTEESIAGSVEIPTADGECKKTQKSGHRHISCDKGDQSLACLDNASQNDAHAMPSKLSGLCTGKAENREGGEDQCASHTVDEHHCGVTKTHLKNAKGDRRYEKETYGTKNEDHANDQLRLLTFNRLIGLCEKGDSNGVVKLFDKAACSTLDSCTHCLDLREEPPQQPSTRDLTQSTDHCQFCKLLNFHDEKGQTLLVRASINGHCDVIWLLMKYGADPSICCNRGKTPYSVAKSKDARNTFRRFMAEFPSKYDYQAAQIPTPLTAAMEEERNRKANEKKKAQRKARKSREKTRRSAEADEENVKSEGDNTKVLTEREKRAMAAERRFGTQLNQSSRCANCGCQVDAKQAFARYDYLYCTTDCVHQHRQKIGQ